jgi:hypothetical protein
MSARKELTARELLDRFGLMPEQELATLLGVSVKTLKNRRAADLPAFTKSGRRRLFWEKSVREYLERRSSLPA